MFKETKTQPRDNVLIEQMVAEHKDLLEQMKEGQVGRVPLDKKLLRKPYKTLAELFSQYAGQTLRSGVPIDEQQEELVKTIHLLANIGSVFGPEALVTCPVESLIDFGVLTPSAREKIVRLERLSDRHESEGAATYNANDLQIVQDSQQRVALFNKSYLVGGETQRGLVVVHKNETVGVQVTDDDIRFGIKRGTREVELFVTQTDGSLRHFREDPTNVSHARRIGVPTSVELASTLAIIRHTVRNS